MNVKFKVALCAVVVLLFMFVPPVAAGGGGGLLVLTLDELPRDPYAGEPLQFGFMLRRGGQSPETGAQYSFVAENQQTGETVQIAAREQGAAGHYVVDVTFPSPGAWKWQIVPDSVAGQPLGYRQFLPLEVLSAAGEPVAPPVRFPIFPIVVGLGLLSGLVFIVRRWGIPRQLGYAAGAIVVVTLLAITLWPSPSFESVRAALGTSDAEYGRALFFAKGCISCHTHAAASSLGGTFGPNLTRYQADPAFLREWLNDPSSVRPATFMPTLGLSDEEITALIAFLNEGN